MVAGTSLPIVLRPFDDLQSSHDAIAGIAIFCFWSPSAC